MISDFAKALLVCFAHIVLELKKFQGSMPKPHHLRTAEKYILIPYFEIVSLKLSTYGSCTLSWSIKSS